MTKLKHLIYILLVVNYGFSQKENLPNKNLEVQSNNITTGVNEALIVVNGKIFDKVNVAKIPEKNIQSISILKDKEALLKYNELGKNGVIEITTNGISKRKIKQIITEPQTEIIKKEEIQLINISGLITDCENIPIPGVQIKNNKLNKIIYSDSLGKYNILCPLNDVIVFSKQNYQSQTILISNTKEINVKLKAIQNYNISVEKPVIYLYPKEKTDIELGINFKGNILTTFPKLEESWQVTAYENGQIFDKKTNRFYNSLFWDGEITFPASHYQYKNGFVVEKEKLTSFLIEKLEFMGLNHVETNDFIQYWLPILEKNETNFIHFLVNESYDIFSTNKVHPKPDTSIRIFMEFFGVHEPISIAPQVLPQIQRKGFTLVEWGGSDVSNQKPMDNLKIN